MLYSLYYTMVKLILLGRCCRITHDTIDIQLKTETSLFEWVWSDTMTEINSVIQRLIDNKPIVIHRADGNDYMEGTNIKTSHYVNTDYAEIVNRRSKRFMNDIVNNNKILFVRDDALSTITEEEITSFCALITTINPLLTFKLLLLSNNEINHPNVYHKLYNKPLYKTYINDCFAIEDGVVNKNIGDLSDDER